jgi:predicted DNA-binding protein
MNDIVVTSFRMSKENHDLLTQVSQKRSETLSSFIRRAILKELATLGFLSKERTQALGIELATRGVAPRGTPE